MNVTQKTLPLYELKRWMLVPPAVTLVAVLILLFLGEEKALRVLAAVGVAMALGCQLLEVVREQYKFAAQAAGRTAEADVLAPAAFRAKTLARYWGLLAVVTAVGGAVPDGGDGGVDYADLVAGAILVLLGGVLWFTARDVGTIGPPTKVPASRIGLAAGAFVAAGIVILAVTV